jgi:hypothetical protein
MGGRPYGTGVILAAFSPSMVSNIVAGVGRGLFVPRGAGTLFIIYEAVE